jgi:hypothetical protein
MLILKKDVDLAYYCCLLIVTVQPMQVQLLFTEVKYTLGESRSVLVVEYTGLDRSKMDKMSGLAGKHISSGILALSIES